MLLLLGDEVEEVVGEMGFSESGDLRSYSMDLRTGREMDIDITHAACT